MRKGEHVELRILLASTIHRRLVQARWTHLAFMRIWLDPKETSMDSSRMSLDLPLLEFWLWRGLTVMYISSLL